MVQTLNPRKTVYVSIGNSDDKLTQADWSNFVTSVEQRVKFRAHVVHGSWRSLPDDPWQNACWCFEISSLAADWLMGDLKLLACGYGQDSIAWAEVPETLFLEPKGAENGG